MKNLFVVLTFSVLVFSACSQTENAVEVNVVNEEENSGQINVTADLAPMPLDEVAKHADESSCYSVVDGKVYDLTEWMVKHPGGKANILKMCGKDATEMFRAQHGDGEKFDKILEGYYLSDLAS